MKPARYAETSTPSVSLYSPCCPFLTLLSSVLTVGERFDGRRGHVECHIRSPHFTIITPDLEGDGGRLTPIRAAAPSHEERRCLWLLGCYVARFITRECRWLVVRSGPWDAMSPGLSREGVGGWSYAMVVSRSEKFPCTLSRSEEEIQSVVEVGRKGRGQRHVSNMGLVHHSTRITLYE